MATRPSMVMAANKNNNNRQWVLQNPDKDDARASALQGRLEEILIMELHRDG